MDLSFSGAGFMGCYYFGVVNCWNKYIPRERVRRVAGASAGSLIAAYYLMDLPLDACLKEIIEMTENVRARPLGVFDRSNQIVDVLPKLLDRLFPDDAHKRVNGRLFVSMTRLKDLKNVMVNQFDSKKDLIDALNCSCFIPVWSGNHVACYKGVKHVDGGFTNNLPVFDEHTIRICCFSGASDIAPSDKAQMLKFVGQGNAMGMPFHVNWKNMKRCGRALWPPPPSYIVGLLEQGFHDAKDFILSNDLIQCDRCFNSTQLSAQPIYSKRAPTMSCASSPSVSRASSFLDLRKLHSSNSSRTKASGGELNLSANSRSHEKDSDNKSPRVHIKPHRQQHQPALLALFEQDRSKSGKKIKRKCVERSQSELYKTTPLATTCHAEADGGEQVARASFATKLREKLVRVASSTKLTTAGSGDDTGKKEAQDCEKQRQMAPRLPMPTILIEQPTSEQQVDELEADNERQIVTIMDIMKAHEEEDDDEEEEEDEEEDEEREDGESRLNDEREQQADDGKMRSSKNKKQLRTLSESSSGGASSSNDSAVGLDATPSPTIKGVSGSPAEKFFASSKAARQVRAASLATSAPFTAEQQAQLQRALQNSQQHLNSLAPARFSAAPSPLPSCPPSPNLNRHCTECIRLRQRARMDDVDDTIRCEALRYGTMKLKDPQREFNSFRARLTGWLRQLGSPKYSYSFDYEQPLGQGAENETTPKEQRRRAARPRRASLTVITPPSQIPTYP